MPTSTRRSSVGNSYRRTKSPRPPGLIFARWRSNGLDCRSAGRTKSAAFEPLISTQSSGSVVDSAAEFDDEHPLYRTRFYCAIFFFCHADYLVLLEDRPSKRVLQLPFAVRLDDFGGTIALGRLFNFGEGSCVRRACGDVSAELPFRLFTGGTIVGERPVSPVAEPSTLAVVGAGLIAALARRCRA